MSLQIGQQLGSFEITSLIGKGGMGEVYRAKDTKLKRDVAIKILPDEFSRDTDRVSRFQREAESLAALNHQNIAAIYDLQQSDTNRYLVLEFVEGETLADRIARGPLPLDESLNIAKQISEALEVAHQKGIIHRDLKPANVKITPEGKVKVLDFGLAKAFESAASSTSSNSPTLSMAATNAGVIMGTAAYMAPEQARGKPVDKRADIWAFGVVLYEMLTGKRLFEGETVSEILAGVLKERADLDVVPAKVRPLLRRCLEKDPAKRLRDIGEAMAWLESAPETHPVVAERRTSRWLWPGVAAVASLAALSLGFLHFRQPAPELRVVKFPMPPPEKTQFATLSPPAVSPDGRRLVFVTAAGDGTQTGIWVRDLDSLAARLLSGTEGAGRPFWSPDSRFVAFFAGGKLKKIDVAGGPALTLCDANTGVGGSWSKNDVIVFAPDATGTLFRVSAAGGSATPLSPLDQVLKETAHRFPWFLPDGHHFLYTAQSQNVEETKVYVGDLDSKVRHQVLAANSNAVYAPPGFLLFIREQTLMAQPFDADKAQTTGDAVPIAEGIGFTVGGGSLFSSSEDGVLVYASGGSVGENVQLTWFDRSGKALGAVGTPGVMYWPAISPDGNTVAVDRLDPATGRFDLWLHDLARGTASRFTFDGGDNSFPIWSPDGSRIAFRSARAGVMYQKAASGTAPAEALDTPEPGVRKRPVDWSRDGRYLIMEKFGPKTGFDVWALPLTSGDPSGNTPGKLGDGKPFSYVQTDFQEQYGKLSPDGHWLAYVSNETKRNEVYVQTFPNSGGKWQVSTNGGSRPVWSRDGKELFFTSADQKMMAAEVRNGGVAKFEAGVPKPLFDTRISRTLGGGTNPWFDVTKDGRFLIPTVLEQSAATPMTVVLNWTAGLKK